MLKTLFVCALLLLSSNAFAGTNDKILQAFSANYKLYYKSDAVGKAVRKLEYQADGTVKYSYKTTADWFVFSDHREEYSIINMDQLAIVPSYYSFQRKGTGKNKNYEWLFDTDSNTAIDVKKTKQLKVDYPERFQDKLSYHLQMRLDLMNNPEQKQISFPVINTSGTIKDYVYEHAGEEQLSLPYGEVRTIKYKREVADKKRVTYAWFAPELDYLLVKLTQFKKSKEQFDIQLTAVDSSIP